MLIDHIHMAKPLIDVVLFQLDRTTRLVEAITQQCTMDSILDISAAHIRCQMLQIIIGEVTPGRYKCTLVSGCRFQMARFGDRFDVVEVDAMQVQGVVVAELPFALQISVSLEAASSVVASNSDVRRLWIYVSPVWNPGRQAIDLVLQVNMKHCHPT